MFPFLLSLASYLYVRLHGKFSIVYFLFRITSPAFLFSFFPLFKLTDLKYPVIQDEEVIFDRLTGCNVPILFIACLYIFFPAWCASDNFCFDSLYITPHKLLFLFFLGYK